MGGGGGGGGGGDVAGPAGPVLAWTPSLAPGENTSETESIESRESAKSRDTSPSHSPPVSVKAFSSIYQPEVSNPLPSKDVIDWLLLLNIPRMLSQTWIRISPNVRCLKLLPRTSSRKFRPRTSVVSVISTRTSTAMSAQSVVWPLTRNVWRLSISSVAPGGSSGR